MSGSRGKRRPGPREPGKPCQELSLTVKSASGGEPARCNMPKKGKRGTDLKLLVALACGATVEAAARQAGVSESTAYRRKADADFQRQLQALRGDMVQRAAGMLTAA